VLPCQALTQFDIPIRRTQSLTSETRSKSIRILGIGGSPRQQSKSLYALKAALAIAEEAGAQTSLADVRALDLPIYNTELPLEAYPDTLRWLLDEARAADAYILCSPTYHGTMTGSLKNVLDALEFLGRDNPPYFADKLVGLMALGGGALNVINSLHHTARALNGLVVPAVVAVPGSAIDLETGAVTDGAILKRMSAMIDQILDLTRRLRR
jgi:FMN reductase